MNEPANRETHALSSPTQTAPRWINLPPCILDIAPQLAPFFRGKSLRTLFVATTALSHRSLHIALISGLLLLTVSLLCTITQQTITPRSSVSKRRRTATNAAATHPVIICLIETGTIDSARRKASRNIYKSAIPISTPHNTLMP